MATVNPGAHDSCRKVYDPSAVKHLEWRLVTPGDPTVREVLGALFDAVTLAEPAQGRLWQSERLTLTQLAALRALRGRSFSAGDLAETLAISPTSLTRILDRLESRRFVRRRRDDPDRRKVSVYLLPAGVRLLDTVAVLDGTPIRRAVEAMTTLERRRLQASLTRLAELTRVFTAEELEVESGVLATT